MSASAVQARTRATNLAASVATWALVAWIALLGYRRAAALRGVLPDYDALSYLGYAFHLSKATSGAVAHGGPLLPFTNTLDVVVLALLWKAVDFHVGVWLIHTGYIVAFVLLARRLLDAPTTLLLVAWSLAHVYMPMLYNDFVSEMKVGLLLALLVAYLFHPAAREHRLALLAITVLLLGLRTIDALFVLPLVMLLAVIRALEGRRREALPVVAVPLAAVVLYALLLWPVAQRLWDYVVYTSTQTRRNWQDMSHVHGAEDLFLLYFRVLFDYNLWLQRVAPLVALAGAAWLAARARWTATLRDYTLACAGICAVLLSASSSNANVVFWVFMLEGLLFAAIARAALPTALVLAGGLLLAAGAAMLNFRSYHIVYPNEAELMRVSRFSSEVAAAIPPAGKPPVVFENFAGVGPIDVAGLEISGDRLLAPAPFDPFPYGVTLDSAVHGLQGSDVAVIANRNFFWPQWVGVNRLTGTIAEYMDAHAGEQGWTRAARIPYPGDASRYVDLYLRRSAPVPAAAAG